MTTPNEADGTLAEPTTPPPAGTPEAQAAEETISLDEARKLRAEAAALRKRTKEAEARLAAIDAEKLTEAERRQRELQQLAAERDALAQQVRLYTVQTAAASAGALYPDAVARLVPADVEDVAQAIAAVRKQYPALFRGSAAPTGSADGGAGGKTAEADMNTLIRRAAGRG